MNWFIIKWKCSYLISSENGGEISKVLGDYDIDTMVNISFELKFSSHEN